MTPEELISVELWVNSRLHSLLMKTGSSPCRQMLLNSEVKEPMELFALQASQGHEANEAAPNEERQGFSGPGQGSGDRCFRFAAPHNGLCAPQHCQGISSVLPSPLPSSPGASPLVCPTSPAGIEPSQSWWTSSLLSHWGRFWCGRVKSSER